jgi:(5-formylfuran-3-yl)methyl phosphate synthase
MTALLASVRSADEALDAARAGADLIDLKEPDAGSLGAVPTDEITRIVGLLRAQYAARPISAAVGDLSDFALDETTARVLEIAGTGVDYVKVGVSSLSPGAAECLLHLADLPAAVVPVLLSDDGVDIELVALASRLGFAGIMFDTAAKDGRTLFDCVAIDVLRMALAHARAYGVMTGLAGSLRYADLEAIRSLAPDIAGFRGALCDERSGRRGRLDPSRVEALARALHGVVAVA